MYRYIYTGTSMQPFVASPRRLLPILCTRDTMYHGHTTTTQPPPTTTFTYRSFFVGEVCTYILHICLFSVVRVTAAAAAAATGGGVWCTVRLEG